MTYRVRNIGIAVALAVIAALLTSFYVTNYKRHVQRGEDHVTVLVAKHDIPVGTAGSDAVGMMSTTEVPRRSVVPGSISSPDEIKSLVASQETFAGEQITTQRFSSVAQTGVEGQLRGNLRAFQVAGDQNQLLAGTLKDNDHVDLVAAITVGTSGTDYVFSRVVLRDLKVLQAPSAPAPIMTTRDRASLFCPASPMGAKRICREYFSVMRMRASAQFDYTPSATRGNGLPHVYLFCPLVT